ncbi:MAG: M23 family metallopeptidase [Anaeromyxobacter sp.]
MVSLALDPPPSPHGARAPRRSWRGLALLVALLLSAAGGFMLGRATSPGGSFPIRLGSEVPGAPAAQAPVPASPEAAAPGAAVPGATAQVAQPQAVPPQQPAAGQLSAAPAAPSAQPAAPAAAAGPRRIAIQLSGALEDSISAAIPAQDRALAEELTQVVNRLLVWDLQVARDGRRGDQLEIVYSPPAPVAPGMPISSEPVVEAVRYASQKLMRTVAAYRYQAPGQRYARYYRPDGSELEERLVATPVQDYDQVTSLLRDGRRHKGVDFRTPVGTPVYATFDGVIERRNWNWGANGNSLDVRSLATGQHAIYLHLDVLPKEMVPGKKVSKGEQIALSGNSGHSFAPHLHYQLESGDGAVLDPFAVQATHRMSLDAPARAGFDAARGRLDAQLAGAPVPPAAPVAAPAAAPAATPLPASGTAAR